MKTLMRNGRDDCRVEACPGESREISLAHATPGAAAIQGRGGGAGQQDGAHCLGVDGPRRHLSGAGACRSCLKGLGEEEKTGVYISAFTNCRGDEDFDAKRSRPSIGKPVTGHARKERVLLFGTDQRITSGPAAKRPHSKAEYMTAPERFADSQIPLAPRAPSIHGPLPSRACTTTCPQLMLWTAPPPARQAPSTWCC